MKDLESIAIALQYKYEKELDNTGTDKELRDITALVARKEFQDLDEVQLDKVADLVTTLYRAID